MHILLVSSAVASFPSARVFHRLHDVTLHEVTRLEDFTNKNIILELVFFDSVSGMEDITQQVQLYQQKRQPLKWLVINVTGIQQSLLYLQLGASGIIMHPDKKTIQDCFQAISRDQLYLEADFIQILALRQLKKILSPFKKLTAREYDVFCMLAEDYSMHTIAELLSISTKTAFNCQAQLRKKLAIRDQQGIIKFAKKHGLIH